MLDPLFAYEVRKAVAKAFHRRIGLVCICDTIHPYTLRPDGYGGMFIDAPPIGRRYSGPGEELYRTVTQRNTS
jgi:hypothetical protein